MATPSTRDNRSPATRERGVHLGTSQSTADTEGIVCPAVTPRVTEWLPDLLASLREATVESVQTHTPHTDPWRASSTILDATIPEWTTLDDTWDDATAEAVAYTRAIAALAIQYDGDEHTLSTYHDRRRASLVDTTESVGTGRGPVNANFGALAKGPVALHRELDDRPRLVTLLLDGPAWTKLTDRRTGVRALAAIAVLADGFDVRVVATPRLQRELTRRYPTWSEIHLGLTAGRDRSHQLGHRSSDEPFGQASQNQAAWAALDGLETAPGKRRLLGTIAPDTGHRYSELADNPTLDIERGTVGRYVLDLESRGLVAIDRRGRHNTVTLTDCGETAVSECLTADYELQHPTQAQLSDRLTATTHDSPSTVSPPRAATATSPTTVEPWLAATGDATDGYVRWIDTHDAAAIHRRFTFPATTGAVTLVDDPAEPFDDGRVSYLSHVDDECLAIVQWGGPLATLGRLAGALLSDQALDEILTPSRLGEKFGNIHGGCGSLTGSPGRTLRRGQQVGWFSEHEEGYAAWRERIAQVRDAQLARLGRLTNSDDSAARGELFEDLHGLVASATQLYHAAGVDLTVTIRIPDTESLAATKTKRTALCDFIRHTVPKQSVYGVHSGYRMLFETRPAKLKRRLPYDVDDGATMELTTSWVFAGPTVTELQPDIAGALHDALGELRDAVADGTETAPTLTVPVRNGTTYAAIRDVVDAVCDEHDDPWSPRIRREIARFCLQSFGRDVPHRASPYDAVTCLVRALDEPTQNGWLTAVTQAATTVPCDRFRPALSPTATKLYATLLRASEPLGRQALIDRADISASSYDRRIGTVCELARVQPTTVDGHRAWIAPTRTLQLDSFGTTHPRHQSLNRFRLGGGYQHRSLGRLSTTPSTGSRERIGAERGSLTRHPPTQPARWNRPPSTATHQTTVKRARNPHEKHSRPPQHLSITSQFDPRALDLSALQTGLTTRSERRTAHTSNNHAVTHDHND